MILLVSSIMGLCKNLSCCAGKSAKVDKDDNAEDRKKQAAAANGQNGNADNKQRPNGAVKEEGGAPNGKAPGPAPVYAQVNKKQKGEAAPGSPTSITSSSSSAAPPVKAGFLVSFVVDSRGSAMTGCRGSGLRLIIPPGAVEQPVRVTCRFIRPQGHQVSIPRTLPSAIRKKPAPKETMTPSLLLMHMSPPRPWECTTTGFFSSPHKSIINWGKNLSCVGGGAATQKWSDLFTGRPVALIGGKLGLRWKCSS